MSHEGLFYTFYTHFTRILHTFYTHFTHCCLSASQQEAPHGLTKPRAVRTAQQLMSSKDWIQALRCVTTSYHTLCKHTNITACRVEVPLHLG